ncbi:MAG: DUF3306 domain-containing protein [Pseudomonadota bacterium]
MADDGFLSRWSRRKALARSGAALPPEPPLPSAHDRQPLAPSAAAEPADAPPSDGRPAAVLTAADSAGAGGGNGAPGATPPPPPAEPVPPPAPTLEDVQRLTPEADFRPFVRPEVAPEVRNAALRKLFADPHFNQMDGLDVYIDDYSRPDPLPLTMARQMVAAQFVRLFDTPDGATAPAPAEHVPPATEAGAAPAVPAAAEGADAAATPAASAAGGRDPSAAPPVEDAPASVGPTVPPQPTT